MLLSKVFAFLLYSASRPCALLSVALTLFPLPGWYLVVQHEMTLSSASTTLDSPVSAGISSLKSGISPCLALPDSILLRASCGMRCENSPQTSTVAGILAHLQRLLMHSFTVSCLVLQ